jgi:ABC-type multidrug transport system ATPase subunit
VGGMRIKSLSKTFKGGICSKTTVLALRNISIEIEKNELMSILGHNGAGKTTLINILTGILSPDYNRDLDITINNESINNIDEVRRYIGVCPQFDILWKEMSAAEHLRLFARLKGISSEEVEQKIDSILEFVSLLK